MFMTNEVLPSVATHFPLQLGMLLYPGLTLLDLAGPQAALGIHGKTYLLSGTLDPVLSDTGVPILPTHTFAECPANLDVLFVPGGQGTNEALKDKAAIAFLAKHGPNARYVTSVCTGSIILAAAGLLDGYQAATHWAFYDQLGATATVKPVHSRVVIDRNRITGGGVTAGVDFGLTLLSVMRGESVAKITQLMLEYDPQPPFNAGTPETAGHEVTEIVISMVQVKLAQGVELSRHLFESRMGQTA